MSEILNEQSLRYAANQYATSLELDEPFNRYAANDFKEGAKWQLKQLKDLLIQARELIAKYDILYPNTEQSNDTILDGLTRAIILIP